jgi:hypothetical protein
MLEAWRRVMIDSASAVDTAGSSRPGAALAGERGDDGPGDLVRGRARRAPRVPLDRSVAVARLAAAGEADR